MQPATICSARDATCNAQRRGPIAALRCAAPQVRREADAREVRARLEDGADLVEDDDGPSCRGLQVARASLRLPASAYASAAALRLRIIANAAGTAKAKRAQTNKQTRKRKTESGGPTRRRRLRSSQKPDGPVSYCKLDIDIHKNEPNILKHEKRPNPDMCGLYI
jgi:hypothetical protein